MIASIPVHSSASCRMPHDIAAAPEPSSLALPGTEFWAWLASSALKLSLDRGAEANLLRPVSVFRQLPSNSSHRRSLRWPPYGSLGSSWRDVSRRQMVDRRLTRTPSHHQ